MKHLTFYNYDAQLFESTNPALSYRYVCGSQMFIYELENGLKHAANVDGFFMPTVSIDELKNTLASLGVSTAYLNLHPSLIEPDYIALAEESDAIVGIQSLAELPLPNDYSKSIRQKLKQARQADWVPITSELFSALYASQHYTEQKSDLRLNVQVGHCEWIGLAISESEFSYACFGIGEGIVEYLLAASSDEGRWLQAGLLYRMMERYSSEGFEMLNLGGGISPGDGLEKYKRRLAGDAVPKRTVRLVVDEAAFRVASKDCEPGTRFPPYF